MQAQDPNHHSTATPYEHEPQAPIPEAVMESVKHSEENRSRAAALSIAVLVHAVLIAALAFVVIKQIAAKKPDLVVAATQMTVTTDLDMTQFLPDVSNKPARPSSNATALVAAPTHSPISLPTIDIVTENPLLGLEYGKDFGPGGDGVGPGGPEVIPTRMKGRCDAADRAMRLRAAGGEMKMERAVVKALRWLKSKQNSDGSWGNEYPVSMTGLALLAYCGHCETVDSPEFGGTVLKAITYLVEKGKAAGDTPIASQGGRTTSYEHAIAIYALAEAYSLNKNSRRKFPMISPVLKKGIPVIVAGQTSVGGWLYNYGSNGGGDLSVSGWNVQALKAAELTGLKFSGLKTRSIDE